MSFLEWPKKCELSKSVVVKKTYLGFKSVTILTSKFSKHNILLLTVEFFKSISSLAGALGCSDSFISTHHKNIKLFTKLCWPLASVKSGASTGVQSFCQALEVPKCNQFEILTILILR